MQPWYTEYLSDSEDEDEERQFFRIAQQEKAAQEKVSFQVAIALFEKNFDAPDDEHHETYIDKDDLAY